MSDVSHLLYDVTTVRELERRATVDYSVSGPELMRRAADICWRRLRERWPAAHSLLVICGSGNNGGDGYEVARLARAADWAVKLIQVGAPPMRGDAVATRAAWLREGGSIETFGGELPAAEVLVDALLGIGLSRAPEGEVAAVIAAINRARARGRGAGVVAVDLPSGLDATTGAVPGVAIHADLTVTFIGNKLGLHTGLGQDHAGAVQFDALGLPPALHEAVAPQVRMLKADDLRVALPPRPRSAHKGRHGHVLVIGGNTGMAGAALLAARGALRAGAGLVSVATRPEHALALTAAQPELMCHGVSSAAELEPLLARATVVAIGPGLGQDDWASLLWKAVSQSARPLIVDADALNLLAQHPIALGDAVLTPHPGEAARLLGVTVAAVQAARLDVTAALSARYAARVVLKGVGTLISDDAVPWLCPYGNPGMGVGGMGDVLTGVIAALRAQGLEAALAARTGVLVHALAGDFAAVGGQRGLLPDDLIAALRAVVNPA